MLFKSKNKQVKYITFLPDNKTLPIRSNQTILETAIEANIDLPYSCGVGSCKSCMVTLESGKIDSLIELSYTLEPEEIENNCILTCQSLVKEDAVIKVI